MPKFFAVSSAKAVRLSADQAACLAAVMHEHHELFTDYLDRLGCASDRQSARVLCRRITLALDAHYDFMRGRSSFFALRKKDVDTSPGTR